MLNSMMLFEINFDLVSDSGEVAEIEFLFTIFGVKFDIIAHSICDMNNWKEASGDEFNE